MLVATDVAARGLDIPEVDLVIQCEPPKVRKLLHARTRVCVCVFLFCFLRGGGGFGPPQRKSVSRRTPPPNEKKRE